jgi:carbamoylphosphate synthase large subunit
MATILVSGVGGPAGSNVTELLMARGFDVVGTDMREVKFPGRAFYLVPPAADADYLNSTREIVAREHAVLFIPTVSDELTIVAVGWRGTPSAIISPADAVATANDKYLTAVALSAAGVPVPRFALPSQFHNPQELAEQIGWPCISKPRVGRGGRDVRICETADWPVVAALGDRYILQEFASGTDYAPNVFIAQDGNDLVVVLEKTELKEGRIGNACSVRQVENADIGRVAIAAARAAGLVGPQDVDIRKRSDGQPVVLEINARFGANIRFAQEILDATLLAHRMVV